MGRLKQMKTAFCCISFPSSSDSTHPESSGTAEIPSSKHIVKLNESLYELCKPSQLVSPNMQVLFFHGLQFGDYVDAHFSTWKSKDGSCIWPQTWLVEQFPNVQVFCVSYNADVRNSSKRGTFDMHIIGENLTSDLMYANIGQEPNSQVILVGHSFGGLVIKQLCLQAFHLKSLGDDKPKKFLESIKGIFYYGTPHHGSPFMNKAMQFLDGPLLQYVKTLSKATERLNFDFDGIHAFYNNKWRIDGVGESLATKLGLFQAIIVPEASARDGQCFNIVEDVDHISICKPKDIRSRSFYTLTNFLDSIAKSIKEQDQAEDRAPPDNFEHLPKEIVGVEHVVENIKARLDTVTSLGLVGMGGIGKTTIAMAAFNILGLQYEYSCFIREVKNIGGGIELVKRAILEHVHHHGKKDIMHVRNNLQFLEGKCLFLVLDDASEEHDLTIVSILQNDIKVDKGSRFIVTSRDAQILNLLEDCYEIPLLDPDLAKHLFINLAFRNPGHNQANSTSFLSLEEYVDDVVKKCARLPLTLEVVGKYLRGKSEEVWENIVQVLDNAEKVVGFDEKLWAKLKVSYDGLDDLEKDMFLDAATVLHGENLDIAKAAWGSTMKGLETLRWKRLVDLSLVWEVDSKDAFEEYTCIGMHEQLQSLGRKIASTSRKYGKCSRVWNEEKEALELLGGENCTRDDGKDVVALEITGRMLQKHHKGTSLTGAARNRLCRMEKLRYLSLNDVDFDVDEGEAFPLTLVSLHFSFLNIAKLPFNPIFLKQLAFFELYGCNQLQTFPPSFGDLCSLRILHISDGSLVSLPETFGNLSKLETLKITSCPDLQRLPETFGNLSRLKILKFNDCDGLESLPEKFGNLSRLKILEFRACNGLERLPERFGNLSSLETLKFEYCGKLERLSETFGKLSTLKILIFNSCVLLEGLPETFKNLSQLETLEICGKLKRFPQNFGKLLGLKTLKIINCDELECLPETFGNLSRLETLKVSECWDLQRLPETFGSLSGLDTLEISECSSLEKLPESFGNLSSLKSLKITECSSLERLPQTFGNLSGLESLEIHGHLKLESLPETFGNLPRLQTLDIIFCGDLNRLPQTFGNLSGLKHLAIRDCQHLHKLPNSIGQLVGLEYLELWETCLDSIPNNIESLRSLKTLKLGWIYTPVFPTMPSQLADAITWRNYNRKIGWTFDIVDGKFNLKEDQVFDEDEEYRHQECFVHGKIMKSMQLQGFRVDIEPLSQWNQGFLLQERGILKRMKGDLEGALEDLTMALDKYMKKGEDNYECRKHRGFVRFLMKDFDGASVDGQRATEIIPQRVHEPDYGCWTSQDGSWKSRFLGREPVEFLNFKLN